MRLEGSTALVTGANRGIGRAIAEALAAAGVQVLAGVRSLDRRHELGDAPALEPVRMDLSSPEAIESSFRELGHRSERIDILVNNAGVFTGGLLERHDVARLYELVQVNLAGPIHLTRLVLPGLLERGAGKIVNNASIIGHAPFPGATAYAASKAGLHGFSESLRRELEPTELTVLELVTPGVDTEMMDQVQADLAEHFNTEGWDHVEPADWARKVVGAIEDDADELNPGGGERLAKLLPKALLDLATRRSFDR